MPISESTIPDKKDTKRKSARHVWFSIFGVLALLWTIACAFIVRSHAAVA